MAFKKIVIIIASENDKWYRKSRKRESLWVPVSTCEFQPNLFFSQLVFIAYNFCSCHSNTSKIGCTAEQCRLSSLRLSLIHPPAESDNRIKFFLWATYSSTRSWMSYTICQTWYFKHMSEISLKVQLLRRVALSGLACTCGKPLLRKRERERERERERKKERIVHFLMVYDSSICQNSTIYFLSFLFHIPINFNYSGKVSIELPSYPLAGWFHHSPGNKLVASVVSIYSTVWRSARDLECTGEVQVEIEHHADSPLT